MRAGILALLLGSAPVYALDWTNLTPGTKVVLTEAQTVNVLLSGATMMCRMATHYVYPKVKLSPVAAQGQNTVYAKYFTVVDRRSDTITYQVSLQSDQLPCSCVLHLMQAPEFWRGPGRDFSRLAAPDLKLMAKEKPVPGACIHNPQWLKPRGTISYDKILSI